MQSLPCDEIIIVDDFSEVALEQRAIQGDVEVIRLEKNVGPGGARNAGILAASGDIIGFCDADDLWGTDKVRWAKEYFASHPEEQYVWHEFGFIDQCAVDNVAALPQGNWTAVSHFGLHFRCRLSSNGFLFRSAAGILYPEIPLSEDRALWLELSKERPLKRFDDVHSLIGKPLVSNRGLTSQIWKAERWELYVLLTYTNHMLLACLAVPWSLFKFSVRLAAWWFR